MPQSSFITFLWSRLAFDALTKVNTTLQPFKLTFDPQIATKLGQILWYTKTGYHHQVSCLRLLTCAKYQLLIVISEDKSNMLLLDHLLTPNCYPKNRSNIKIEWKQMSQSSFSYEITYLCKMPLFSKHF